MTKGNPEEEKQNGTQVQRELGANTSHAGSVPAKTRSCSNKQRRQAAIRFSFIRSQAYTGARDRYRGRSLNKSEPVCIDQKTIDGIDEEGATNTKAKHTVPALRADISTKPFVSMAASIRQTRNCAKSRWMSNGLGVYAPLFKVFFRT